MQRKHMSFYQARARTHCNSSEPIKKVYVHRRANQKPGNRGRVFRAQYTRQATNTSHTTLHYQYSVLHFQTKAHTLGNWELRDESSVKSGRETRELHTHRAKHNTSKRLESDVSNSQSPIYTGE